MKIRATFKGKDGSNGFRKGTRYTLDLTHKRNDHVRIVGPEDTLPTPYTTMITFLKNWKKVKEKGA